MLQLSPALWLETPKGTGLAHLVTWDSLEHSLYWTVFIGEGPSAGEIWTYANEYVRAPKNITAERNDPKPALP